MEKKTFGLTVAIVLSCGAALAAPPGARGQAGGRIETILRQTDNLRQSVLELALAAYQRADDLGYVKRPRLTIIDYELPSYLKRLWVIDMTTGRVLHEEWVAHGMGSPAGSGGDLERALSFSNRQGTRKSSLGLFRTAETYLGRHGYSLRLDGLEPGINDAARDRTIVVHPADYVTRDRAVQHMVGRSWGCPAVRPAISRELIDDIKHGSLVWTYFQDTRLFARSAFLGQVRSGIAALLSKVSRPLVTDTTAGR
jgi:hypothetical protein